MAVAPTGAIYKALEFDGVSSRTYGVYITGEAVYNAPERDVEMITIPGRSGSFALDNGRFQNIEVSYPAGIFADTEADFRQAISDFRNFLCSRKGYVRLQDEYNPDEYRMAVYKSGLEVDPAMLKAGEFKITFDCKPQRWLISGETEVAVDSGDTLTNPTLFESSPLLEVYGYGAVSFNDYDIEVLSAELGEIKVTDSIIFNTSPKTITMNVSNLVLGDAIYVKDDGGVVCSVRTTDGSKFYPEPFVVSATNVLSSYARWNRNYIDFQFTPDLSAGFVYGTSSTITCSAVYKYYNSNKSENTTETVSVSYAYDGASTLTITVTRTGTLMHNTARSNSSTTMPALYGDSSKIVVPAPVYIDCDLGEAYGYESGELVSYNNIVTIPADLPKLASGPNLITYDNTITDLKITPHWWKV